MTSITLRKVLIATAVLASISVAACTKPAANNTATDANAMAPAADANAMAPAADNSTMNAAK